MDDFLDELYPELTLETDDIVMTLSIKKDYSKIKNFLKLPNLMILLDITISIWNLFFQILF